LEEKNDLLDPRALSKNSLERKGKARISEKKEKRKKNQRGRGV